MNPTLGADLARIVARDLDALAKQIESYPDDRSLWRVGGSTKNSAGTLALHLVGNLEYYVGAVLGGSGYVRNRDTEFAERDVPRREILSRIEGCRDRVKAALESLSDEAARAPFPEALGAFPEGASTHLFLVHLVGHLSWHLGQVDYHRRLLIEAPGS
jgi:hypothetical protein